MNRIRQLREARGMTQQELGKILNVQGAAISKYESGKIPLTVDTINKLTDVFEVSIDYLLCKTDDMHEGVKNIKFEATTTSENGLLEIYRNYKKNGYSKRILLDLIAYIPELYELVSLKSDEDKLLKAFDKLDEDNRDIIIGETKKLLKSQRYEETVTADDKLKEAK